MEDNILHVYPVDDMQEHMLTTEPLKGCKMVGNTLHYTIASFCKCEPTIEYQDNGNILVIHNSFDGREGVEQANEILNNL